jgi:hypothetical protein
MIFLVFIAYSSKSDHDKRLENLEAKDLNFTKGGMFTDFLGIKSENNACDLVNTQRPNPQDQGSNLNDRK